MCKPPCSLTPTWRSTSARCSSSSFPFLGRTHRVRGAASSANHESGLPGRPPEREVFFVKRGEAQRTDRSSTSRSPSRHGTRARRRASACRSPSSSPTPAWSVRARGSSRHCVSSPARWMRARTPRRFACAWPARCWWTRRRFPQSMPSPGWYGKCANGGRILPNESRPIEGAYSQVRLAYFISRSRALPAGDLNSLASNVPSRSGSAAAKRCSTTARYSSLVSVPSWSGSAAANCFGVNRPANSR